jgi:hypothetical protein
MNNTNNTNNTNNNSDNDNNEGNLINKVKNLPDVLIEIIKNYLTDVSSVFLNKQKYITNHYLIRPIILKNKIENYIRYMIRRDYDFVFQQILLENYTKWLEIKHYMYKNIIYKNYIYFIKDYCIENESVKCRNLINLFLKEHGLCQNQHKNNIIKNKRWKF